MGATPHVTGGKTSRETAQLPPIIAACHQQHLASTLREQLTLPVRLAYAIWVAIVHFRVDYYPHDVGFGTHSGEPPKVAGPLQGPQKSPDQRSPHYTPVQARAIALVSFEHKDSNTQANPLRSFSIRSLK